jgi:hypothetical protein
VTTAHVDPVARPPIPASAPASRHPDRRTTWAIVLLARLQPETAPSVEQLRARLLAATDGYPLVAARLRGSWWYPSEGPDVVVSTDVAPLKHRPITAFALEQEPPLRITAADDGSWLMLCAHHFAFDGLSMAALLRTLLTGEPSRAPDYARVSAPRQSPWPVLQRLARPAERVAPSPVPPGAETFVSGPAVFEGPSMTARLAGACTRAVVDHNAARHRSTKRIGISVGVGGVGGESATYRRVDISDVSAATESVGHALSDPAVPPELAHIPRGATLLRPVLNRLSDTILVSNLGRQNLPGASSLEFFPVARGRSAVAFGAATVAAGSGTLTVRARDLTEDDAAQLLDRIVDDLQGSA